MFSYEDDAYSIECQQQEYTIVLDISDVCAAISTQGYCLGVVSDNDGPRSSNCLYWGGNERQSYAFQASLTPLALELVDTAGERAWLFTGEAAWTRDVIRWIGETRVVPWTEYGVPFFTIAPDWRKRRTRMFRLRHRRPPVIDIYWNASGSGAVFSANTRQKIDALEQPYWSLTSVTVTSGGSGYNPYDKSLSASVTNGTGSIPPLSVSGMSYTQPVVSASVSHETATPAQLSVALQYLITLDSIPLWTVDSVAVQSGGGGYPPNATIPVAFSLVSGYYRPIGTTQVADGFFALTNSSGVVQSVVLQPPFPDRIGRGGRGEFASSASVTAVSIGDGVNEFVGLTGVAVNRVRSAPTVVAIPPDGSSGMSLGVSLQQQGSGPEAYWSVSAVSVIAAGIGFDDQSPVTFSASPETLSPASASAVINATRLAPELTASASGGTGATFTVTLSENAGPPKTWSVSGITVTNGGSGYPDGAAITFTPGAGAVTVDPAYAYAVVGRIAPTVTASASGGTGAQLSVTLSQEDWYGTPYWAVSGVSVSNGGTGYTDGDPVAFNVTDGVMWLGDAYASISVIEGVIVGVQLSWSGGYFKSSGIITGIAFFLGGSYYRPRLDGVTVTSGGKYYVQTFVDTSTPLPPLNCKEYPSGWEAIGNESGTQVGDSYKFADVYLYYMGDIIDTAEIGHEGTRICENPVLEISIQ